MGDWPARSGDGPADMLVATRWERICRGWAHRCRYQRCGAGFRDAEVGFADQMSARGPVASLRTRPWRREGTKARFLRSEFLQASTKSRSEEHTSELQSLMRISYAVFCLKKKKKT